jgi:hypothetical protein
MDWGIQYTDSSTFHKVPAFVMILGAPCVKYVKFAQQIRSEQLATLHGKRLFIFWRCAEGSFM